MSQTISLSPSASKLFVIAGEASGDAHGAGLLQALAAKCPNLSIHGLGGPKMKEIAQDGLENWIEEAAVVGLWEVIKHYGYFRRKFDEQLARIEKLQPSTVLLIDYPGFNLRLAKVLRAKHPQLKIIYYISPQVWAWNRGRIPKMAKWLDLMICIFPFEAKLYSESGLRSIFAGHPIFDHLGPIKDRFPREENLIALLPGSRNREISKLFPRMIEAARQLQNERPQLRFVSAAPNEAKAQALRNIAGDFPIDIGVGTAYDVMQRASVGWVASGTATLEASFFGLPYVLVYAVAPLTYFIGKRLIKVPYLGIVNILAQRPVITELIQDQATPATMAQEIRQLLDSPESRNRLITQQAEVIAGLGGTGAYERAAEEIVLKMKASP